MAKKDVYKDIDGKIGEILRVVSKAYDEIGDINKVIKRLYKLDDNIRGYIDCSKCTTKNDLCMALENYLYLFKVEELLKENKLLIHGLLEDTEATRAYNRFINVLDDSDMFEFAGDDFVSDYVETHKPSNYEQLKNYMVYWSEGIQTTKPDLITQCIHGVDRLIRDNMSMRLLLSDYITKKGLEYSEKYKNLLADWTNQQYITHGLLAIEHFQLCYINKRVNNSLQNAIAVPGAILDSKTMYYDVYSGLYQHYLTHYEEVNIYRDNIRSFCKRNERWSQFKFYFYIECKDFVIIGKKGKFLPIYFTSDFFKVIKLIGMDNVDGFICESNGHFWMHSIKYIKANLQSNYTVKYIGTRSQDELNNYTRLDYKEYIKVFGNI